MATWRRFDAIVIERGDPRLPAGTLAAWLASKESDGVSGRLISALWDDWANLGKRREELNKTDIYTLRRIVPEDRGVKW